MAQVVRPAESRGRIFSDQRARAQRRTKAHALHFRGRHHAAAISVVVILVVVMFQLFPRRDVTILSDGQAFRVSTAFDGSSEALAAADVNVEPGDRTLYGSGGKYNAVIVQRARPVIFEVDGVTTEKRTRLSTVGGALADAGIVLGPNDKVLLDGKPAAERVPLVSSASLPKSATNEQGVTTGLAPGDASAIPVHISVIRARPVTVFVDTERRDAQTSADTIGGLLTELGMPVRESDLVSPGLDQPVLSGMTIRLAKARTVALRIDGRDSALYTQAATVGEVVRILGMKLSPEELLDPPADTAIVDGMTVVIGTTRTFDEEVASDIAPTIVYDNDPTQPASYVKIVPGAPGVLSTTYRVTLKNGVETGRAKVGVPKVIQAPIATHRIYGGRQGAIPAAGAVPGNYKKKLSGVRATWYNAQHGGKAFDDPWYGITATGAHLDFGICAVDPSVIPFHTLMWIPGYGTCLAEDTGGGIRGLHVDLGYPESVGDPGWGDRVVEVYILD